MFERDTLEGRCGEIILRMEGRFGKDAKRFLFLLECGADAAKDFRDESGAVLVLSKKEMRWLCILAEALKNMREAKLLNSVALGLIKKSLDLMKGK